MAGSSLFGVLPDEGQPEVSAVGTGVLGKRKTSHDADKEYEASTGKQSKCWYMYSRTSLLI